MVYQYNLRILPGAKEDLDDILNWYTETSVELAQRFINEIYRHLLIACDYPYIFIKYERCRKITMTVFPYLVFYRVIEEEKEIELVAILHSYRNPKEIRNKINM